MSHAGTQFGSARAPLCAVVAAAGSARAWKGCCRWC